MSGDGNPRRPRVANEIRDVLSELIAREVKDPRVHAAGLVSISHVELNSDMSVARVYVSFYGADDRASARAIAGLDRAAGFLRGPLARRLRLRHAPSLRFVYDTSIEFGHRLTELVRDDAARAERDRSESELSESRTLEGGDSVSDSRTLGAPDGGGDD